jgi:hypothetical protein
VTLEALERDAAGRAARVIPLDRLLGWLPAARLDAEGVGRVGRGQPVDESAVARWEAAAAAGEVSAGGLPGGGDLRRLLDASGRLVAIARRQVAAGAAVLQPFVVLV